MARPRNHPPYGDKRDYRKIDLYRKCAAGWDYVASTTWARSCKEARERYAAATGCALDSLRAYYDWAAR